MLTVFSIIRILTNGYCTFPALLCGISLVVVKYYIIIFGSCKRNQLFLESGISLMFNIMSRVWSIFDAQLHVACVEYL